MVGGTCGRQRGLAGVVLCGLFLLAAPVCRGAGSLEWLRLYQEPDGRWDAEKHGGRDADPAVTGLSLLAFLGAGHTEKTGEHEEAVRKAVQWIMAQQDEDGCIGRGFEGGLGYHHAVCGLALAEAYGMARVAETGVAAQKAVECSVNILQTEGSGWSIGPDQPPDLAVTGWFVMQLRSSLMAGLRVDPRGFQGAMAFLERCSDDSPGHTGRLSSAPGSESDPTMTAVGMVSRQFMGWRREEPLLTGGADFLAANLPDWKDGAIDYRYWYCGSLGMFQMGGDWWKAWNASMRDMLIEHQRRGEAEIDGSWDPAGNWSDTGGRVYSTAMATLCLEIYYRYLPVYETRETGSHTVRPDVSEVPDVSSAPGSEDAISDVPLGGTGVVGNLGIGGGAAGAFGFRSGGGRRRAALRGGGSRASEAAIDGSSGAGTPGSETLRGGGSVRSSPAVEYGGKASGPAEAAASDLPPGKAKAIAGVVVTEKGVPEVKGDTGKSGGRRKAAKSAAPGAQRLKGGSRDDNAEFEEFVRFRKEYRENYDGQFRTGNVIDVDICERHVIEVRDVNGRPVPGAGVRVLAGERQALAAKTYADGKTLFFPRALGLAAGGEYAVEAEFAGKRLTRTFSSNDQAGWRIDLPVPRSAREPVLDLLFCLDTTGSMGDEILAIQTTLKEVVRRIDELPGDAGLRFGLVEYRDRGDAWVTRVHDFTPDVEEFQGLLDRVQAGGGGDTPESVNEALHRSVQEVTWIGGPEGVRLVFLVADAPPHMDYPEDFSYADEMKVAHSRAIRIYPLAASGLDRRGEYVFRQLAQYTSAKFLFITYGGRTTHDVKPFRQNNLDDIVVEIVSDELAAYRTGVEPPQAAENEGGKDVVPGDDATVF